MAALKKKWEWPYTLVITGEQARPALPRAQLAAEQRPAPALPTLTLWEGTLRREMKQVERSLFVGRGPD